MPCYGTLTPKRKWRLDPDTADHQVDANTIDGHRSKSEKSALANRTFGGRNCARPSVRASKQFFACFAQFVKFKFAKLDDTEPSRHQRRRLCASKGAGRKRTRRSAAETTAQIRTLAVGVAYEISRWRVLRPVNAHLARLAIWPGRFLAWLRRLACTACT